MTATAYELAKDEVGIVEWKKGSNPKVVQYYHDAGHFEIVDDAVPWCAAFVGAMLHRAGLKGTDSLAARSYLKWGTAVDIDDAQEGDICIFERGNSGWQGHVTFFVRQEKRSGRIVCLGGNQQDAVNLSRYSVTSLLGVRRADVTSLVTKDEKSKGEKK